MKMESQNADGNDTVPRCALCHVLLPSLVVCRILFLLKPSMRPLVAVF